MLLDCSRISFRQLSSTNIAGPSFTSPPPAARSDLTLVGPLGPLQNQDMKTSTAELSPAFHRHRTVIPFGSAVAKVSTEAFISPNSVVAGDVCIGDRTSIWYGSVVRGDENAVSIGAMTSIQERTVVTTDCEHTDISIDTDGTGGRVAGFPGSVQIGDYVTIEPGCILRACTVESKVIIGAGSVICEGALVESGSMIGSGSVVPPGRRVPAGQLWSGRPVAYVRDLSAVDDETIMDTAVENYHRSIDHLNACYPLEHHTMLHQHAKHAFESNH